MTNNSESNFPSIALKLFILGLSFVLIGALLLVIASILSNGFSGSGGIILIGPFPIIFATGENAFLIVIIAALVTVVWVLFFLLMLKRKKTETG